MKVHKQTVTNMFCDCGITIMIILSSSTVGFPKDVEEACKYCNDNEKHAMRRFLENSEQNYPELHIALKKKLDPENKYFDVLKKAVANA